MTWRDRAACVGREDLFLNERRAEQARQVCTTCPVVEDCLQDEVNHEIGLPKHERWGVRGGLTAHERWLMTLKATACVLCGATYGLRPRGKMYTGACNRCADEVREERYAERFALSTLARPQLRCLDCGTPTTAGHDRCAMCAKAPLRAALP